MAFPGSGQRQQKGRWISMVHAISCSPSGIVIKEILLSHKLAFVCCEGISISGNFYRNKTKHSGYASPQDQMRLSSLDHLKVFDGILLTCEKKTCMIIPAALKVMHLKSI